MIYEIGDMTWHMRRYYITDDMRWEWDTRYDMRYETWCMRYDMVYKIWYTRYDMRDDMRYDLMYEMWDMTCMRYDMMYEIYIIRYRWLYDYDIWYSSIFYYNPERWLGNEAQLCLK